MNDFFHVVAALMIVFLFIGDPDVWDKLHDKAMQINSCEVTK